MTVADKQRLDSSLFERGLAPSREKARALVMAGEVTVNGQLVDKPGTRVAEGDILAVRAKPRFVSRGGRKAGGRARRVRYRCRWPPVR